VSFRQCSQGDATHHYGHFPLNRAPSGGGDLKRVPITNNPVNIVAELIWTLASQCTEELNANRAPPTLVGTKAGLRAPEWPSYEHFAIAPDYTATEPRHRCVGHQENRTPRVKLSNTLRSDAVSRSYKKNLF
jgi:hypothetical protein